MEKIQYFCDICKIECQSNEGLGTLAGFLIKITSDLKPQRLNSGQHLCHTCFGLVLKFLEELKNEHKSRESNK